VDLVRLLQSGRATTHSRDAAQANCGALRPSRLHLELKHDGFRALSYIQNHGCKLIPRNQNNLRFTSLKKTLEEFPIDDAIIDGEIICIDEQGISQFNSLLDRKHEPILYAFDLLWLNGEGLRQQPLIVREKKVSHDDSHRPLLRDHVRAAYRGTRQTTLQGICKMDLEGVIAKRKLSVYKDNGAGWLKIKNRNYSQAEGRHELLTRRRTPL
jgi:bifunctional non-homologous end joining protein LigD